MYFGNELGIFIPRGYWRRRGPSILRLHQPIKKIPKSILEHKEAIFSRGRIQTKPIFQPKVRPSVIVERWKRPIW